jgi:hypothetical protein
VSRSGLLISLRKKPYGTQVILLIAFLAFVRVVMAIIIDLNRQHIYFPELLTDGALLILFGGLLTMGIRKAGFQSVHWIFGILVTLLLAMNFLQFGGVSGSSRFNYYCCFFIAILLYEKQTLIGVLTFQVILLVIISLISLNKSEWIRSIILTSEPDPTDFFFVLPALGILTFYLKSITIQEIDQFNYLNEELGVAVGQAKHVNHLLHQSSVELTHAQEQLSREMQRRTKDLAETKNAIESYIQLNSSDLQEPVHQLNQQLKNLPNETLTTMLLVSTSELTQVIKNIHSALETEEDIDRNKIRTK